MQLLVSDSSSAEIHVLCHAQAIAMCESAEADNDRLLEEVESLQMQLDEARKDAAELAENNQFSANEVPPSRSLSLHHRDDFNPGVLKSMACISSPSRARR